MIRNYVKVAIRNLLKRKTYTFINILGLATGMATCLLIVLFIRSEKGFDTFHQNSNHIYRMVLERKYPGRSSSYAIIPQSIGAAVQDESPDVKESVRIFNFNANGNFIFQIGDKTFEEKYMLVTDSNFLRVFTCLLINGNPATALMEPNSIILSESAARKYFGSATAALNKQITTNGNNNQNNNFIITAVCKDWPENSHFRFNMLISSSSFAGLRRPNYIGFSAATYFLLNDDADPAKVEARFPEVIKKYVAGDIGRSFGQTYEQFVAAGNGYHYYLQKLKNIHLDSDLEAELGTNGSRKAVYIFSVIAVFILLLACINFINLSTSRSLERAKEVGLRKTFGSERRSLIFQFLTESILVSLFGMLLAFGLIFILLPLFNQVSGKNLTIQYFADPASIAILLAIGIVVGLIAGIYPAFVLSSFRPLAVLRGKFKSSKYGLALRNGLVIFQFAISVVLIISTVIVNRQMRYMMGNKLGFQKDQVIVIERGDLLNQKLQDFKNELSSIPNIVSISGTSGVPGFNNYFGISFRELGSKQQVTGRGAVADEDLARTLGFEMKEGRFFSKDFPTDSLAVVINEKAVAAFDLKNPIGARLENPDSIVVGPNSTTNVFTVIGVVKDFHFQSLHQEITPLVINHISRFGNIANLVTLRLNTPSLGNTLASIENVWKKLVKDQPFHYDFLDQSLAAQYHAEKTMQRVFSIFSVLAIFIACIGLLGLAAYATQQRKREISIRKVMGANVSRIITMLSRDFLKLVIIASLIAFPLGWLGMHKWLQDFAYRVDISWWIFITAALGALLVAVFTICFQAIRAALANPVKSLRNE